jgi:hypothetical protein
MTKSFAFATAGKITLACSQIVDGVASEDGLRGL